MEPFKRITSIGHINGIGTVYVTAKWNGKSLSITGVEGPKLDGDARGGCGQITLRPGDFDFFHFDWTPEKMARLQAIWDRWHLNDMRPGCEHQRAAREAGTGWDTGADLELVSLTWGPEYHKARRRADDGKMTPGEYAEYQRRGEIVHRLGTHYNAPKSPALWGEDGERLLRDGWLKQDKTEIKAAGWVSPVEHPGGLLGKPCEVCGYRYGTAWLYEDVPADVLEFLAGMPDASRAIPGRWAA